MSDADDHFTQRLCFNVYATNRAFGRFYQAIISESGLTYLKFVILNTLKDKDELSISELSARAGVESNTLSPLLKNMALSGLITRTRKAEDERRVVISLTEKGRRLLEQADQVVQQGFSELGLDYCEVMRTVAHLEDIRSRLEQANPRKFRPDQNDLKG